MTDDWDWLNGDTTPATPPPAAKAPATPAWAQDADYLIQRATAYLSCRAEVSMDGERVRLDLGDGVMLPDGWGGTLYIDPLDYEAALAIHERREADVRASLARIAERQRAIGDCWGNPAAVAQILRRLDGDSEAVRALEAAGKERGHVG